MKIMTDRQFREELEKALEKALWERDRFRDIGDRFDRLEKRMWEMEDRLRRLENLGATPVNDCAVKMETTRNG